VSVLAILKWDPTIRGLLFPAIQFLFLAGSAYVIMATNVGNRLGFLLASAAFWGWMTLMAIIWLIYGIGPKGAAPSWHHKEELFNTKYAQYSKIAMIPNKASTTTPKGWKSLADGSPVRGEAQSAIDAHIGKDAAKWVSIGGFETGGEQRVKVWPKRKKINSEELAREKKELEANLALPKADRKKSSELFRATRYQWFDPRDYAFRGLLHGKRYYVGQVQQALEEQKVVDGVKQFDDAGKPVLARVVKNGKSVADPNGKVVTHVLTRDLGSLRLRSFRVFVFSLILTIISVFALHFRDKKVMTSMGQLKPKAA
jgi:hypothetical protein